MSDSKSVPFRAFQLRKARLARGGLRFALTFGAIAAALFAVYCFPYQENGISEGFFTSYLDAYARAAGAVLGVLEPHIVVSGNNIIGRFSMSIIKSCDAMEANILFCAAVLAFPAPVWRKPIAVIAGLAALIAANLLRLCSLYYVGVYFPSSFEFMHVEFWPLLMMAVALLDFVAWVRWMQGPVLGPLTSPSETAAGHASP